jgi:hypothetical protein
MLNGAWSGLMKITKFTSIARILDPHYPTNLGIIVLCVVVMIGGALIQTMSGVGWLESGLWGIRAGVGVFFAWAVARELDPDNDFAAFIAAGLALTGLALWDLPYLGALFWLMLVLRIVNRTTGLPATVLDSLLVLGMGGWLSFQGNWYYSVFTVIALLLDSRLEPKHRRQLAMAGLGLVITVSALTFGEVGEGADGLSIQAIAISLALAVVFAPVIAMTRSVESVGDETGERLSVGRIRVAQGLAIAVGLQEALLRGMAGLVMVSPLWAAISGVTIYRYYQALHLKRIERKRSPPL